MKKKITITIICAVLSCVCLIGTTFAWLKAETAPITNTFTYGDINITLEETTSTYKMVPGNDIAKDPEVTVKAGSEKCWLFVKLEKANGFADFMTYEIAEGWTEFTTDSGIYYRVIEANESDDQSFGVLKDNKVTVLDTVTREQFKAITDEPELVITAYAVQYHNDKIDTADEAWAIANP